jgi:transitional endoplasmic reticulum ATPase
VLHPSALDARRGIVRLHPTVFAGLGLAVWDTVILTGRRTTGALAAVAPPGGDPRVVLCDDLVLGNLGVTDGTVIDVAAAPTVPAVSVVAAADPSVATAVDPTVLRTALLGKVLTSGDNASLLPQDLAPLGAFDVVTTRKSLAARLGPAWTSMLLTITDVSPAGPALVTMATVVGWQGGTTTTGSATPMVMPTAAHPPKVTDLPGLESQAAALQEWLDLGFHHRDLLTRLGTQPGMGVLVTGPAGSGKAALVEAVTAGLGARLMRAWAPELASLDPTKAAEQITALLSEAARTTPAVVLLEDIDALVGRDNPSPLVPVFLTAVRDVIAAGSVAVVCTTSRPESVAPELRAPGTLDHELAIPLPDRAQRRRLLDAMTHAVPLDHDVSLDDVAGRTPGFVAADVIALVREAGLRAAARQRETDSATVSKADFDAALEVVRPTAMGGETLDLVHISLDDVGDMTEVKEAVTEAVLWPLQYPDTFTRLGVAPPRGLLLYGPPGCGKTFLVKAIAGSGQCNVLSVKGAELLNKWVGESERAVRELFRRAREAAPALIFLDEVDALAPVRGQSTDGGTTDRVVASLLTELDGVESLRNVVVIAATNRPDLIDPALLRPGRLERLIFVPPPDAAARAQILKASAKSVPLDPAVDLAAFGDMTEGFSSADCAALIREAALGAMRESMSAKTVTAAHLEAALAKVKPSLDPAQVASLQAFADRRE